MRKSLEDTSINKDWVMELLGQSAFILGISGQLLYKPHRGIVEKKLKESQKTGGLASSTSQCTVGTSHSVNSTRCLNALIRFYIHRALAPAKRSVSIQTSGYTVLMGDHGLPQ